MYFKGLCAFLFSCFFMAHSASVTYTTKNYGPYELQLEATIALQSNESLYKDSLELEVDNPAITLNQWSASPDAHQLYDPHFKENKDVYTDSITLLVTLGYESINDLDDAALHITYLTTLGHSYSHEIIPLKVKKTTEVQDTKLTPPPTKQDSLHEKPSSLPTTSWLGYFDNLLKTYSSFWLQLLLIFLLGIMLSLTPCIYPMIPITIGILQSQGTKSFTYNCLLSLMYTLGMATTYAIFGLFAGCVGPLCGRLLVHPIFVVVLIIILGYFALSMMGLYEMYIPQWMQKPRTFKGGSLISTYLFGALSGTIASPCVSPGLAVVLTMAASLGSSLLGFILLFVFGIGLSMPLLLVGTFSSSLKLLPQAGMWMVEIKRLFGLLMVIMCFYYAQYIIPVYQLLWILVALVGVLGIYYLHIALKKSSGFWKQFNICIGFLLITSMMPLSFMAIKAFYQKNNQESEHIWFTDYQEARALAQQENKLLFLDFWASFCSVCIAINKHVLTDSMVLDALQHYVPVKIDGTYASNEPYAALKDTYSITGFPAYLIVDPTTEKIIAQYGAELYSMERKEVVELLQKELLPIS